jgi:hypothetical protein
MTASVCSLLYVTIILAACTPTARMETIGSYFYFLARWDNCCVVGDRDGVADRDMLQAGTRESPLQPFIHPPPLYN